MSNKIKILHVMAGGDVGGAENIFLEDVLALQEHDMFEQAVLTRPAPERIKALTQAGIITRTAGFSKWFKFPTKRALQKLTAEFQPHIIQYWMGRAGQYAITGNHKNVAWYGGYYNRKKRFALCSHHIVLTRDLYRHVVESGAQPDDVKIIHTIANFPEQIDAQPRRELNTPDDAPVFLALARLHWKKGLDILLKALVAVPEAYAWIAGDGPLKDELHTLAQDLGVADRVRFLGWRHDRERLLKSADFCAFPSRYEPFGTTMVDAWAMRVPLIAAASQGPAAYVVNGENGLLIPTDDVDALIEAMRRLINDKELCAKIVAGGWDMYQQSFTKEAFWRDSLDFYKQVITS
ncbi:MAG TPA: glycosyltransferase [Alphaproteobacteria bacterium]